MVRLLDEYRKTIRPKLAEEFGRKNINDLPWIEKICLNMGVGAALQDSKLLDAAVDDMTTIAGQRAVVTRARKSVSNFKLRQGWKIGCRVTLRGARMYEFLDRLLNAAMPRIRDFRGLNPRSFDDQGNYSIGLDEQTIFPEINPDRAEQQLGMNITIVIKKAQGVDESRRLLALFGMPFRGQKKESAEAEA